MTRSPLLCCTSIIRSSPLVQASSSLSMICARAWPTVATRQRNPFPPFFARVRHGYLFLGWSYKSITCGFLQEITTPSAVAKSFSFSQYSVSIRTLSPRKLLAVTVSLAVRRGMSAVASIRDVFGDAFQYTLILAPSAAVQYSKYDQAQESVDQIDAPFWNLFT